MGLKTANASIDVSYFIVGEILISTEREDDMRSNDVADTCMSVLTAHQKSMLAGRED